MSFNGLVAKSCWCMVDVQIWVTFKIRCRQMMKKKTRIGQKWNNIGNPVSVKSRRHRLTIYFPDIIITLVSMSDKKSEDWQSQQCSSSTDGSALISWDKKTACQTDTAIYWTDCLIRIAPEHLKKERKNDNERERGGVVVIPCAAGNRELRTHEVYVATSGRLQLENSLFS